MVQVDTIGLQTVVAAASAQVAQERPEVVLAQEPLEGQHGRLDPLLVTGDRVRRDAGVDHGVCFQRLLIETGPVAVAHVPAVAAHGHEAAVLGLQVHKPIQRPQTDLQHVVTLHGVTGEQERVRDLAVVVGDDVLGPGPVRRGVFGERAQEALGQEFPAVAWPRCHR